MEYLTSKPLNHSFVFLSNSLCIADNDDSQREEGDGRRLQEGAEAVGEALRQGEYPFVLQGTAHCFMKLNIYYSLHASENSY